MEADVKVRSQEEQMARIKENVDFIKANIDKLDGPIMIELLGTPKSGKTTLVTSMESLFKKGNVPVDK